MVKKTSKFRSGLEEAIADELDKLNVDYGYEDMVISYLKPARKTRYTPDFTIKVNGEIWESKGRFQTADRKKHLLIKEQHPNIKIKFIFSNSKNKIGNFSPPFGISEGIERTLESEFIFPDPDGEILFSELVTVYFKNQRNN